MSKLNILVLHQMGDPLLRRQSVQSLEFMIPESRPDLNCVVHDTKLPFPEYLKDIDYGLIVLGPTFLSKRTNKRELARLKQAYAFIRESVACKVALPQDDYNCSAILDQWMVDWKIDRIYPVCSRHWDVLYPQASQKIELRQGYTGYISQELLSIWLSPKSHLEREIDVSYRATKPVASFGRVGFLKGEIGNLFRDATGHDCRGLNFDISSNPYDTILGKAWYAFVENSKFCLVAPSGSSLLDSLGDIRDRVEKYVRKNRKATFLEIEANCFSGLDHKKVFTAVSPRNIEAALAETVQIALPGDYSGLMRESEHFIRLEEDCSNISDVLRMMKDKTLVREIQRCCKESFLSEPRLRRKNIVNEIIDFAEKIVTERKITTSSQLEIERKLSRYYREIPKVSERFWHLHRLELKIYKAFVAIGAEKPMHFLIDLLRRSKLKI